MAFFGVLTDAGRTGTGGVTAEELHVNLWCLGGLLGGRFLLDVGVMLRAGENPVGGFSLAIPFDTKEVEDLADVIRLPKNIDLVFDAQHERVDASGDVHLSSRTVIP